MVKKFKQHIKEEELKDFEEDVLGDTQSKEVEDKKEVKKSVQTLQKEEGDKIIQQEQEVEQTEEEKE